MTGQPLTPDEFHKGYLDLTPEERFGDAWVEMVEMPAGPFRDGLRVVLLKTREGLGLTAAEVHGYNSWLRYRLIRMAEAPATAMCDDVDLGCGRGVQFPSITDQAPNGK